MGRGEFVKKLGFMILHTGKPYIKAAIGSLYNQVDKIVVLYSERPSQGHGTNMPCPDTESDLQSEVSEYMDKIQWVKGSWTMEGQHVGAIENYTEGYSWVYRIDADEVVPDGMVDAMIEQATLLPSARFLVHFAHFWRCFDKVNIDSQTPVRLFRPGGEDNQTILDSDNGKWRVLHFGYAIPDKYMLYKLQVSGHRSEIRSEWFKDVWKKNAQEDVHPVAYGLWPKTQDFDKTKLPEILKQHQFYNKEIIQ